MFQELDTPPSRCCWRWACAMSSVSLITADIDQAFEACSASAVSPAWRHISQSYESRFSSNSVLVRQGRRELRKLGRSQTFGRGWFSSSTPVTARALFSFPSVSLVMSMVWQIRGIPICVVMSSAAVAVVLGAAELVWLDQRDSHLLFKTVIDAPTRRSCRSFTSLSWRRGGFPWSRLFCGPWFFPSCSSLTRCSTPRFAGPADSLGAG